MSCLHNLFRKFTNSSQGNSPAIWMFSCLPNANSVVNALGQKEHSQALDRFEEVTVLGTSSASSWSSISMDISSSFCRMLNLFPLNWQRFIWAFKYFGWNTLLQSLQANFCSWWTVLTWLKREGLCRYDCPHWLQSNIFCCRLMGNLRSTKSVQWLM